MITFKTTTVRNCEVDAWDVTVEAFFDMSEMIRYAESGETLTDLLAGQEGEAEDGFRIARLTGLIVKGVSFYEPDDMLQTITELSEIGSTFDIRQGTYSTARNFLGWLEHGGDERIFERWADPIHTLFFSENLETDPHVDRGAMLALMTEQLDQFSFLRLLCVHEEPVDACLPEDQRGLMSERISNLSVICDAREMELIAANPGAEARGKGLRMTSNLLGEPLPLPGQLPLFILGTSAKGYPDLLPYLNDEEEAMVIDVADWCPARFGVTLTLETDEEPELEPY
jgi:hypothetical protein